MNLVNILEKRSQDIYIVLFRITLSLASLPSLTSATPTPPPSTPGIPQPPKPVVSWRSYIYRVLLFPYPSWIYEQMKKVCDSSKIKSIRKFHNFRKNKEPEPKPKKNPAPQPCYFQYLLLSKSHYIWGYDSIINKTGPCHCLIYKMYFFLASTKRRFTTATTRRPPGRFLLRTKIIQERHIKREELFSSDFNNFKVPLPKLWKFCSMHED